MFRSPLARKLVGRARRVRRVVLVVSLFAVAASLPYAGVGAWQQEEGVWSRTKSQRAAKGQANIVEGAKFVPGEVLVRFRTESAAKTAEAASLPLRAADDGEVSIESFDGSSIVRGLRIAKVDAASTLEAVAELASRPDVLYAEPNYIWHPTNTPNDSRFGDQWGLKNTGQVGFNDIAGQQQAGLVGADIDAELAWDKTTGSGNVVVAVIDQGVDINHPDLQANIWTNPGETPNDGIDNDSNGYIDDVNGWDFLHNDKTVFDNTAGAYPAPAASPAYTGDVDDHGTHVAGTIGAVGNNGQGVTGVSWNVRIMSIKVLGKTGGPVSAIIGGYNYVKMMRDRGINVRVTNNSYGAPGFSQSAFNAISALNQSGILFVAAAGNDTTDNFNLPQYPSDYNLPNVISVAATDRFDQLAVFSNFSERGVSMGAPGRGILSTTPHNTYNFFSGTSMATPHVAGAAALVCAAVPDCANSSAVNSGIPVQNLRGLLAFTGDVIPSLRNKTTTGRRLNVNQAIISAQENDVVSPAPASGLQVSAQNGRTVTLQWTAPGDDGNAGTASDYDFFFINPTTGARTLLPTALLPAPAGTTQSVTVTVPYRNFSGTVELRTYDNAGNISAAGVPVTLTQNAGSDPYVVNLSAAQTLSTGGTPMNLNGDDVFRENHPLPFTFPFFGTNRTSINVSSNGALYFSKIPSDDGAGLDAGSSVKGLDGQIMIAGMWDDLRTDRAGGDVFVVQDATRIIFRWQGVTFNTPLSNNTSRGEQPVNFEIELRNDGSIIMRYGAGQAAPVNTRLVPVVGISGGEPDAYFVPSHTSEAQLINLMSAQTVTFTPRPAQVLTIGGRVTDANGVGVANVSVFLSGGQNATRMTDAGGNYSFTGLASGQAYTVTPSSPLYNFAPPSIQIANLTSDQGANFSASLKNSAGPNSVGLAQASYQFGEGEARATFRVTRGGDTSGDVTVEYRTVDSDTFTVGCADAASSRGAAYARCDFATTVGSLSFASGEIEKNITVPLVDDGHVEGAETFQLQLTKATGTGTTLGAQNVATVTITDNDAAAAPNPIVNSIPFFVRMQYLDFLSREPEAGEPWSGVMARCPNIYTGPSVNTDCDRIAVSRAFFESPEFRLKGFYVFRFYRLAFNRLPQYAEIVSDMSFVAGATEAEVYARRAQLATAFAARAEFQAAYAGMSNEQFVSALLARYGLNAVTTPDPATPDSGTRVTFTSATLINQLNNNFLTRGQVFRAIADSDQVQAAEFNSAFVAVQYYGYLRRTPEPAGYQDNLNALQRGVSPREMVNAFLNSAEYRLRFGQP